MDDRPDMQFFGGQQWKAGSQIKPHLMPENRTRAGTGAVVTVNACFQNTR
jgi:hypothetical protein